MKNILKIHNTTYIFILISLLSGFYKQVIVIYLIILIHELGHIIFIKLFKYKITSINIYPFGGITKIDKRINNSITKDIFIDIGGFLFQLIIFIIFPKEDPNNYIVHLISNYNKIILLFNIIPIIPLDGSKLLEHILELFLPYKLTQNIIISISIVLLFTFLIINYCYKLNNYVIIIVLFYKNVEFIKYLKHNWNRFLLERYLGNISYRKINYTNKMRLSYLKRETYHYFKKNNEILSEKQLIKSNLEKNVTFYKKTLAFNSKIG